MRNNENTCLVCGVVIPEGRQLCPICEQGHTSEKAAHWVTEFVPTGYFKKCSRCGARWMLDSVKHICIETPFCHNCGVRLEKENEK